MSWSRVLDTLERQLHRQENAFRSSGPLPQILVLENPDVPMSESEQVRAIDLMQRHDQLIAETVAVLKRRRRETSSPYSS